VLLLFSAIIVKATIAHFIKHEPLRFFRFYCDRLADKVNKSQNSAQQQKVAGAISIVITLVPLLIILWLFEDFISAAWLWHGLLLYFALGSFTLAKESKVIAQALVANQKYLAKKTLNPLVLRDTEQLSTLGMSKTSIEMQLLKTVQLYYAVCFYTLLAGPLAALSYRLLLEMHYSWNVKQQKFTHFGLTVSKAIAVLQWLPMRLFTFVLLFTTLGQNMVLFWRLIRGYFFQLNNHMALYCLGLSLEVKIGGVAMYQLIKFRRSSFNEQARQPEPKDIIHATNKVRQVLTFSAVIVITLAVSLFVIELK
jgi:adenosylcobinamide-phosphate synthase